MNPSLQPLQAGADQGPSPLDALYSSPEAKAQFEAKVQKQTEDIMKPSSPEATKAFEAFATSSVGSQFGGGGYGTGSAIKNELRNALSGPSGGESLTQAQNRIAQETAQLIRPVESAAPVPAPLGTTPTGAAVTATVGTTATPQTNGGPAGMATTGLTLDENSRKFLQDFGTILNSFGTYVDKLAGIKIPDTIEMKGNHIVDVRISGAAAFEGLKKDFTNMIQVEISKKMSKIWAQSNGLLGEAPSQPGPTE
jgi:hypothetical protein